MLHQTQTLNIDQSDTTLLAAFSDDGDGQAFRLLVERYQRMVFGVCQRGLNRDNAAADDATQAVFILLARNASRLDPAALPGWLFKTSLRVVHTMRREAQRRKKREARMAKPHDAPSAQPVAHRVDHNQQAQFLHAAIAKLPPKQRDAILLYYFGGHDQAAVGSRLGCTAKAVQKRIEYGLATLRSRLGKHNLAGNFSVALVGLDQARKLPLPPGLASRCHGAALAGPGGKTVAALRITEQVTRRAAINHWATAGAAACVGLAACLLIWLSLPSAVHSPAPAIDPPVASPAPTPPRLVAAPRPATIPSPATPQPLKIETPPPPVAELLPATDADNKSAGEAAAVDPPAPEMPAPQDPPAPPAPAAAVPPATFQGGGLKIRWVPAQDTSPTGKPAPQPSRR